LFIRRMGHWRCVWIIKPSTWWQWKIDTHYLELMICLIDFLDLKCLVGLTYVRGITKFELQKGTTKRPLVTQGMVHMSFWWCIWTHQCTHHILHIHEQHFLEVAWWFCGYIHRWHFGL
jgi:hypothetical protein